MTAKTILVLDPLAPSYEQSLVGLPQDIRYATELSTLVDDAWVYDVMLAQPALAAEFLDRGGRTRWIQSTWAGVTPLVEPARRLGVVVTGVKGIFGEMIAEYVFAHLLGLSQKITDYRAAQARGEWTGLWPDRISGRQMTIVGTGAIGRHVARLARAFGLQVKGVSRSGQSVAEFDTVVSVEGLRGALAGSDYLVLLLPDTPETRDLVGERELSCLPAGAVLVNVGRGNTISEVALVQKLAEGRLGHAVLDVFTDEPLPAQSVLWRTDGVTITPHIAAISYPEDVAGIFRRNLERFAAGQALEHTVDLDRGY